MAKIICDKHGAHGGSILCEHIHAAIEAAAPLHYTPSSHPDLQGILLCDRCVSELEPLTADSDLEAFLGRMRPHCPVCVRAWREATAK